MSENYKNFDPEEELNDARNFSGILVSPRRAGKTFMMKYLLYHIRNWYSLCYVFSGTADVQQGDPYDFCPKDNIIQGLDVAKLNEIYDKQVERAERARINKRKIPLIILIFDDIINEDINIRSVNTIKKIFSKGRHINIAILVLNQYFSALPPVVRANCDFVGAQKLTTKDDKINFVRAYLSIDSDIEGVKILKEITNEDYQFIIVNLIRRSYNIKDFVFKLKAEKVPKFVIKDRVNAPIIEEKKQEPKQDLLPQELNRHHKKKYF